ncbi:MFS transporter [Aestuariivirga sp.]|uniref:MFS transporter n=1 Tax=Aestuariivirga sp. TaxID=2650926 RepID=UPI003BA9F333
MTASHAAPSAWATVTTVFITFGVAIGALAGSMPSVMRNAGIDAQTFGLGLTLSTLLTVAAMSVGGQIARVASNRAVLLCVLPVFAIALFAYLTAASPWWFFIAVPVMGFCFGLTDLFMNAEAVALEHDMRRPVFLAFHGGVSAGVGVMAVSASFLSTEVGTWAVGAAASLMFALSWTMVYRAIPARPLARGKAAHIGTLPNKVPLMLLGVAAGLIIAAETSAILWSAKLLDDMVPALAAISGVGAAFFGLCNAAVRFPGDRMRSLLGDLPLMFGSLVISIAGFAALGLSSHYVVSVLAFASVGLGIALLIPCIFAMSANLVPENRAGALSFVSMLTAIPRVLTPLAFGLVAARFGTSIAFGLVAVGLLAALVLVTIFSRRR